MLPLDPPLSRGARPGMFNPDRPVDDTALAAFDLDPENPGVQVDLARSLLDGDPENIWAMMVLARHTGSSVEYMALLREAVRVGLRIWAPHLDGRAPAPPWGTDKDVAPFMGSVLAYGMALMETGHRDEAAQCLQFLLQLDPADNMDAVRSMTEVGLVAPDGNAPVRRR